MTSEIGPKTFWYDGRENLAELVSFLETCGTGIEDFLYFLEKPWKWEKEYKLMRQHPDWNNYDQTQIDELQDYIIEEC